MSRVVYRWFIGKKQLVLSNNKQEARRIWFLSSNRLVFVDYIHNLAGWDAYIRNKKTHMMSSHYRIAALIFKSPIGDRWQKPPDQKQTGVHLALVNLHSYHYSTVRELADALKILRRLNSIWSCQRRVKEQCNNVPCAGGQEEPETT